MIDAFKKISVVLVRPAGDLNIGSVARAMMNTGFSDLVLVDSVNHLTTNAFRMAVSSGEILKRARCFSTLHEALHDCHAAFGITARFRHKWPRLKPEEAAGEAEKLMRAGHRSALVFGPEDKGLSKEEVDLMTHLVGIPAHTDLTSYNLAQAVLLVCHTLFLKTDPTLDEGRDPILAPHEEKVRIEKRSLELLDIAGYFTPNREGPLRDLAARIIYRAVIETRDTRGILAAIRHLRVVLQRSKQHPPEDEESR